MVKEDERKFERGVEVEFFRADLTAAEAEESAADHDKIKGWLEPVSHVFAPRASRPC